MTVGGLDEFVSEFLQVDKPPRDNAGRPLLIPRGVEVADENRLPYTRASSLADHLEEFSYLWKWKMRGLAKGLSGSMDLIRLIAAEDYTCGFAEDVKANAAAGRRIDESIERAMDRAGVAAKADYGTAIHSRTEPGNKGTDPDEKQEKDQQSTWQLWADLGVINLATEVFTANDELMTAGTFDHLSYVPGLGIVVTDKKTSSKASSTYDVQLADYAFADVYDVDTDQRLTLEEYVASLGWDPSLINREQGVIWWVKSGRTQARMLNLTEGYRWAKLAAEIRDVRRKMGVAPDWTKDLRRSTEQMRSELLEHIKAARSQQELLAIWNLPHNQAIWTDTHTQAAKARQEMFTP